MRYPIKAYLFILVVCFFQISCESNPHNSNSSNKDNTPAKEAESKPNTSTPDLLEETSLPANGIDISKYQGDEIAFLDKKQDSLSFIICKATEGISYTDPKFKSNWEAIRQKEFIRGAYHFYRTADAPNAQADHFMKSIKDLTKSDIAPIVDFEGGGIDQKQSVETIQKDLVLFLKKVQEISNRKPIIYTDLSTANKYLNKEVFSAYALWIANYIQGDSPHLPNTWKENGWVFWQKSSSYKIHNTKNDFDVFNGSSSELVNFISTY